MHTWIWPFCNIIKLVWIHFTNFFSDVPVTRAAVTARVWRTNPRRSWRPTARACRPDSSQSWSRPSGLVCIPPTSPSTYPGVRCPGRTLWALAVASFSQRSWSGCRTRISSTPAIILIPRLEALFIRRVVFLEPAEIKLWSFSFWANHGCKKNAGSAPGWVGQWGLERGRCVQSEGRAQTIPDTGTRAGLTSPPPTPMSPVIT